MRRHLRVLACAFMLAVVVWGTAAASAHAATIDGTALRGETGPTPWQGCDGLTPNIRLSIDGAAPTGVSCDRLTGVFQFTGVTMPAAGRPLTLYFNSPSAKGATYFVVGAGGDLANIDVVQDRVILDAQAIATVDHAIIARHDGSDTFDAIPVDADTSLTSDIDLDDLTELHIASNVTFDQADNRLTAGSIHVEEDATFRTSSSHRTTELRGYGTADDCTVGPRRSAPLCIETDATVDQTGRALNLKYNPPADRAIAMTTRTKYETVGVTSGTVTIGTSATDPKLEVSDWLIFDNGTTVESGSWNLDIEARKIYPGGSWTATGPFTISTTSMHGPGRLDLPQTTVTITGMSPRATLGPYWTNKHDWTLGAITSGSTHTDNDFGSGGELAYDSGSSGNDIPAATVTDEEHYIYMLATRPQNSGDWALRRADGDGVLDAPWNAAVAADLAAAGIGHTEVATVMTLADSGDSVVVGGVRDNTWHLRMYSAVDGSLDTSFNTTGTWTDANASLGGRPTALMVSPYDDNVLILAGHDGSGSWQIRNIRISDGNTTSSSWASTTGVVSAMCTGVDDDGDPSIFVVGTSGTSPNRQWTIGRLDATATAGVWNWAWGTGPSLTNPTAGDDQATSCVTSKDGDVIWIGGTSSLGGPVNDQIHIRRYESDGTYSSWWGDGGFTEIGNAANDTLVQLLEVDHELIVVGGSSANGGETVLRRVEDDGGVDPSFNDGTGQRVWNVGVGNELPVSAAKIWGNYVAVLSRDARQGGDATLHLYDYNGRFMNNWGPGVTRLELRGSYDRRIFVTGDVTVGDTGSSGVVILDTDLRDGNLDIAGSLNVTSRGKLNGSGNRTMRIGGDLTLAGDFWPREGTIELRPRTDEVTVDVRSDTRFNNLSIRSQDAAASVRMDSDAGEDVHVSGTFTAIGASCTQPLRIRPVGATWVLNAPNTLSSVSGSFVDVANVQANPVPTTPYVLDQSVNSGGVNPGHFTVNSCGAGGVRAPDTLRINGAVNPRGITPATPATLPFTWINRAGVAATVADVEVLSSDPASVVARYPFDGATVSALGTDTSGNGRNLTHAGGVTREASAKFGQGAATSTTTAGFGHSSLPLGGEFTIDGWFRRGALVPADDDYVTLFYSAHNATAAKVYIYIGKNEQTIGVGLLADDGYKVDIGTDVLPYLDNEWHHLAVTYRHSRLTFSVDGQAVAGNTLPITSEITPTGTWDTWFGIRANTTLDDWQIRSVADAPATIQGFLRTARPHGARIWSAADVPVGSVADGGTVTVNYGGGAAPLERAGARFWVRANLGTGSGDTAWSKADWFETAIETLTITHAGSVAIPATTPGQDAQEDLEVTVTTTHEGGWSLLARGEDDSYALSNGLNGANNRIARRTTPIWASGVGGFAGMTVLAAGPHPKDPAWGTGTVKTDHANLRYAWPGETGEPLMLHRVDVYDPTPQTVTLSMRVNPGPTTTPGAYSGVLDLVALPNL